MTKKGKIVFWVCMVVLVVGVLVVAGCGGCACACGI